MRRHASESPREQITRWNLVHLQTADSLPVQEYWSQVFCCTVSRSSHWYSRYWGVHWRRTAGLKHRYNGSQLERNRSQKAVKELEIEQLQIDLTPCLPRRDDWDSSLEKIEASHLPDWSEQYLEAIVQSIDRIFAAQWDLTIHAGALFSPGFDHQKRARLQY